LLKLFGGSTLPEDVVKITFGKDNCQFEQEDVHEKFPQMSIFYLALNPTIIGGLLVDL